MIIKVLGSAAGGGFPQANCNCFNCAGVRAGDPQLVPRTQSSLAVSREGETWALLNASPDIRQQINAMPELVPRPDHALRCSPIKSVVLTNGDVDHVAGLLSLREGLPFTLHATSRVLAALAANSIFNVLDHGCVPRIAMALGESFQTANGLVVEAFAVPGKIALYLEQAGPGFGTHEGDTIGLKVSDPAIGTAFTYIPGCATVDMDLAQRLKDAALVLFDGTLYTDAEMIEQGLSDKTGGRMGHMSMSGPRGSLAALEHLNIKRRVYVHMNNSNPVLRAESPERAEVERAGWEVAFDGMEIRL
jgi:pyrroloquinoline quinone biosynthesis protein B